MNILAGIWRVQSVLGITIGVLSLVLLANLLTSLEFSEFTGALIDYYQRFLDFIFGWTDPYLAGFVKYIGEQFDLNLELAPHWKYVFVLLWVYLSGDARANWSLGRYQWGIIFLIWGGIVALAASLATGAQHIESGNGVRYLAIYPILGIVAFECGKNVLVAALGGPTVIKGSSFWSLLPKLFFTYTVPVALLAAPFVMFGLREENLWVTEDQTTHEFIVLVLFIFATGCLWFFRGLIQAYLPKDGRDQWRKRIDGSASTRFGKWIFHTIFGALLFLILNAGLDAVGL